MQFIGRLTLGLLTAAIMYGVFLITINGLVDAPQFIFVLLVLPLLVPIVFLFLKPMKRTIAASMMCIGFAFATLPVGLVGMVDGLNETVTGAQASNQDEANKKELMTHASSVVGQGLTWFGALVGAILILGGITIWRAKQIEGPKLNFDTNLDGD